jgi:putative restriction endonuclease
MVLSQIDRVRLNMAAVDEGFGLKRVDDGDWLAYDSLGAPASIRLTYADQDFLVAVNHPGVVTDPAERWQVWPAAKQPYAPVGFTAFLVSNTERLHYLVREIWRLARALPIEPLRVFEAQVRNLPRTTEAERWVVQRVGQDGFRDALTTYWGGRCAVTGSPIRASSVPATSSPGQNAKPMPSGSMSITGSWLPPILMPHLMPD